MELKIGEHSFELKPFLTAGDNREITAALMEKVEIDSNGKPKTAGYDAVIAQENALIDKAVVSFNGSSDSIRERLLQIDAPSFNELLKKLRKMIGIEEEKKAN